MKELRAIGLALLAMLAIGAVGASAATADDQLTAESYPATLTGETDPGTTDVFTSTAGNFSCNKPTYHAALNAAASTVSVTPNYGETSVKQCTAFGFPSTFHMNGCTYLIHFKTGTTTEASLDIVCPVGQEITITGNPSEHGLTQKCTFHIPPQTGLETITATNTGVGSGRDITLDINIKSIKYSHTAGTGLGQCTTGSGTTATLTAKVVLKGENPGTGAPIGIFMSAI